MDGMTAWVALSALAVQTLIGLVSGTYIFGRAISRLEVNFSAALLKNRLEIDQSIAEIENELRDQINSQVREQRQLMESISRLISNDVSALRDRLHNHEVITRDTFVRRDSFYKVADELKTLFAKLEAKIDRIQEARSRGRDG